jgi:hypothetical protein
MGQQVLDPSKSDIIIEGQIRDRISRIMTAVQKLIQIISIEKQPPIGGPSGGPGSGPGGPDGPGGGPSGPRGDDTTTPGNLGQTGPSGRSQGMSSTYKIELSNAMTEIITSYNSLCEYIDLQNRQKSFSQRDIANVDGLVKQLIDPMKTSIASLAQVFGTTKTNQQWMDYTRMYNGISSVIKSIQNGMPLQKVSMGILTERIPIKEELVKSNEYDPMSDKNQEYIQTLYGELTKEQNRINALPDHTSLEREAKLISQKTLDKQRDKLESMGLVDAKKINTQRRNLNNAQQYMIRDIRNFMRDEGELYTMEGAEVFAELTQAILGTTKNSQLKQIYDRLYSQVPNMLDNDFETYLVPYEISPIIPMNFSETATTPQIIVPRPAMPMEQSDSKEDVIEQESKGSSIEEEEEEEIPLVDNRRQVYIGIVKPAQDRVEKLIEEVEANSDDIQNYYSARAVGDYLEKSIRILVNIGETTSLTQEAEEYIAISLRSLKDLEENTTRPLFFRLKELHQIGEGKPKKKKGGRIHKKDVFDDDAELAPYLTKHLRPSKDRKDVPPIESSSEESSGDEGESSDMEINELRLGKGKKKGKKVRKQIEDISMIMSLPKKEAAAIIEKKKRGGAKKAVMKPVHTPAIKDSGADKDLWFL